MLTFVTFHVDSSATTAEQIQQSNKTFNNTHHYMQMLAMMFESAEIFDPGCKKVILSDEQTRFSGLPEDVEICRYAMDTNQLMLSRMRCQVAYLQQHPAKQFVLLDSDMLINYSLEGVFSAPFDVGLTYRDEDEMPINGGILFVNNTPKAMAFLQQALQTYENQFSQYDAWWGDQYALIETIGRQNFNQRQHNCLNVQLTEDRSAQVLLLPCDVYNFSPDNTLLAIQHELRQPHVLHFKGDRKTQMLIYWQTYLQPKTRPFRLKNLLRSAWRQAYLQTLPEHLLRPKLRVTASYKELPHLQCVSTLANPASGKIAGKTLGLRFLRNTFCKVLSGLLTR